MTQMTGYDSYTRAVVSHDWAVNHGHIARVQYRDGEWFCEVASSAEGWVPFD